MRARDARSSCEALGVELGVQYGDVRAQETGEERERRQRGGDERGPPGHGARPRARATVTSAKVSSEHT